MRELGKEVKVFYPDNHILPCIQYTPATLKRFPYLSPREFVSILMNPAQFINTFGPMWQAVTS